MRDENKITEANSILSTQFLNQMNLTSADVVSAVLIFCDVHAYMEIV